MEGRPRPAETGGAAPRLLAFVALLALAGGAFWWLAGERDDPAGELDRARSEAPPASGDRVRGEGVRRRPEAAAPEAPAAEPEKTELPGPIELPEITAVDDYGEIYAALTGRVLDRAGNPVPGVSVRLHEDVGPSDAMPIRGRGLRSAATDDKGEFILADLEASLRYSLRLDHGEHPVQQVAPIQLDPGEIRHLDLTLRDGVELHGVVRDAASGRPLAGVAVRLFDLRDAAFDPEAAFEREALTDDGGRYRLSQVGTGYKCITAELAPYATATLPRLAITPAASRQSHDFALEPGLEIHGRVTDDAGRALAGARVSATPVRGRGIPGADNRYRPVRSEASGRYVLPGLREGTYVVRAEKPGYAEGAFGSLDDPGGQRRSMVNADAGDRAVDLALAPAPAIKGQVIDAETGEPLRAFVLAANPTEDLGFIVPSSRQRVLDEEGRFVYTVRGSGPPPRDLWLFALAAGYAGGSAYVDFVQSEADPTRLLAEVRNVVIRVERGVSVRGRVVDSRGRPVRSAVVRAQRSVVRGSAVAFMSGASRFDRGSRVTTGADGRFTITHLRPGDHRVRVEHPGFAPTLSPVFEVGKSNDHELGELTLAAGARVHGTVLDDEGGPEEGVRVLLRDASQPTGERRTVVTGITGAFEFRHVPPGEYHLMVIERGGLNVNRLTATMHGRRAPELRLTLADGDDVQRALR